MKLFSGSIGLNNKVPANRLHFGKGGVSALEVANNVLVDRTGAIVTRRGTSKVGDQQAHSPWRNETGFYFVSDRASDSVIVKATVDKITGGLSFANVASGLTRGLRVSYTEPLGGKVYFSNGEQNGCLFDNMATTWTVSEWTATDVDDHDVVPPGKHICLLSERILIAVGNMLIFTEYGLPGIFNSVDGYVLFESEITMLCPVETGVYVSDQKNIHFLSGANPYEWTKKMVTDYPAMPYGSMQGLTNVSKLGIDSLSMAGIIATTTGPVVAMPDGLVVNLIDKTVSMPSDCHGAGCVAVVDETIILQSGD